MGRCQIVTCHPSGSQRKGQGLGATAGLPVAGKAFSAPHKASPEVGQLQLQPRPRGGGEKWKKNRNKEHLVLKEIPAGGSLNKSCWSCSSPVGKRCHQGHLGRRQNCLRPFFFFYLNPFCSSKKANKCLKGLVAQNESFFSSGIEYPCVQGCLCSSTLMPGISHWGFLRAPGSCGAKIC